MKRILLAVMLVLLLSGCNLTEDYEYHCIISIPDGSSDIIIADNIRYERYTTTFILEDEEDIIISNSTEYYCVEKIKE